MAVVAKTDIQTLTKQLIEEKLNILENMKQECVSIDPSFLTEGFVTEFETKLDHINLLETFASDEEISISSDELENIVQRFDSLDKLLSESKAQKTINIARKENCSIKRTYAI